MRRLAAPLLLLTLLAGCDDGPTDPDRTFTFTGTFTRANIATAIDHPFALDKTSNVRIELLAATLHTAAGDAPGAMVIGLGRPGDTSCVPSSSTIYIAGNVGSHGLRAGNYCLAISSGTLLPAPPGEGQPPETVAPTVTYSIAVEITE